MDGGGGGDGVIATVFGIADVVVAEDRYVAVRFVRDSDETGAAAADATQRSLMRDAVEMGAELGVLGNDVVVADVDEDVEAERLQVRSVFSPSRIVELEPIAEPLLFVGNVKDFDAILLGENPAFVVVRVVIVVAVKDVPAGG